MSNQSQPKHVYLKAIILWVICVSGAVFIWLHLSRPTYATLEADLIAAQKAGPEHAMKLAETLMRDHPSQCMPYQIAANLHSLKKDYVAAETALRSAIEKCGAPPALYVRLAHVYQRAMPEKLNPWISEMLQRPEVMGSPPLAAELLAIGGHDAEALEYLENTVRTSHASFATCMMLSRLYVGQNQHAKAGRLLMDFADNHRLTQVQSEKALKAMFALPAPPDRQQTGFCLTLILQTAEGRDSYVDSRQQLSENLEKLMLLDQDRHAAALLQQHLTQQTDKDLWVWIGAIYLQKIGKPEAAQAMLAGFETTDARLLEEEARLSVHTKDLDQIKNCWRRLLKITPNDLRIRLAYAQILNQAGLNAESRRTVGAFEATRIPEALRWPYFFLCFDNEAVLKNYPALVDTWGRAGAYYMYDDLLVFKEVIFGRLPETEQHRSLLKALNDSRSKHRRTEAAVALLRVFIAEQLRDQNMYFSAADAFLDKQAACSAQTINAFVIKAIAKTASPAPWQNDTKPGIAQSVAAQFAVKWSTYLVDRYPDNPTYQANAVVAAYRGGKISDLQERCRRLLKDDETNHQRVQLVAETYFRLGRFEQAAAYYQKAISLRPDIIRYQFGYAACLKGLQKYDQAARVYYGLLTQPPTARTYDIDAVLRQLWACYEKMQRNEDFISLIGALKKHPGLDVQTLRLAAGTLLLEKARFQTAEKLLAEFIQEAPESENRYGACLKLANCYALQKKYDDAIDLYTLCLQKYRGDDLKTIDCLYNRAEIKRRKGAYQAAIDDWRLIAQRYPTDAVAAEALLAAASVAHETMQDLTQAKALYRTCLDLTEGHTEMADVAKEKLTAISEKE